jgi:heme-degrading monooxygenase HmoA
MYARLGVTSVNPGKIDEVITLYQESLIPVAKKQKGFRGAYLLTDRDANQVTSISLWETEADLHASEASGYYREQVAKFAGLLSTPPTGELLEVSVQE